MLPDGEHHATLDTVEWLRAHEGARVVGVGLDAAGRIDPGAFGEALRSPGVAFGTALMANNESGTINDSAALAAAAARAARAAAPRCRRRVRARPRAVLRAAGGCRRPRPASSP